MNLLVTNTRNAQAYAIIRALRPHARKIVATMEGENRLAARLSHAANSRLVDKRYYTPSPAQDWRAGRIQKENTKNEESYVEAIVRICERENIDTIFPSFDPHVYVFSKNKERFEKRGVLIPIPDYETVLTPLDKYRTIQAAQEAGFPCPRTYLPESESDLRRIAEELGFPLVIKPRFSAAGRGTEMVNDLGELSEKANLLRKRSSMPLIQEYIPGKQKQQFYLMLDRKGALKAAFYTKRFRHFSRVSLELPTAEESVVPPHPDVWEAARFVRKLGWWGGVNVEMKIDFRDSVPKLMETNPRLGARLWHMTELGINAPLMYLDIAPGKHVEAVKDYPAGRMLLAPVEDLVGLGVRLLDLLIFKFRIGIQEKPPFDSSNPPMTLRELIRSCKETYFNGKQKVFNPYFSYFFQDPLVSVLYWIQFFTLALRTASRQLGH